MKRSQNPIWMTTLKPCWHVTNLKRSEQKKKRVIIKCSSHYQNLGSKQWFILMDLNRSYANRPNNCTLQVITRIINNLTHNTALTITVQKNKNNDYNLLFCRLIPCAFLLGIMLHKKIYVKLCIYKIYT